jgi:predicted secreted Zn-dependent protease
MAIVKPTAPPTVKAIGKAHPTATTVSFDDGSQYTVTNGVIGAQTRAPG